MELEIIGVVEDHQQEKLHARVAAGAVAKKVLKKNLGKKFKISGAVTQLGS